MALAPSVANTAPAPVTEYVDHARAVAHDVDPVTAIILKAFAPVIEPVGCPYLGSPVQQLDEGKNPKRAKKSSRRKRPHHHDDDDLLLSEATALADHERTLMREEMRTRLAAELCPLSHLMFMSDRPGQCQLCGQSAEELAWCPCCRCFLLSATGTSAEQGLDEYP